MVGRSDTGFTLVELIAVLLVIGLVTALATPAFHRALPGHALAADAQAASAALRAARGAAIRRGQAVAVTYDPAGGRYWIDRRSPVALSAGTRLTLVTARAAAPDTAVGRIRFYPDGSATGGRVRLQAGQAVHTLHVDWLTGDVRETP